MSDPLDNLPAEMKPVVDYLSALPPGDQYAAMFVSAHLVLRTFAGCLHLHSPEDRVQVQAAMEAIRLAMKAANGVTDIAFEVVP